MKSKLVYKKGYFQCLKCSRQYDYKNNIVNFVDPKELDKETAKELKGNTFRLSKKNISHYAHKDRWSDYYNHYVNKKIKALIKYLNEIDLTGIISLGSGPGFEIKQILHKIDIPLILSSDLALSATSVVPITLKESDTTLLLFTSDLNLSPVIPNKHLPILIYEALHHTGMNKTIEKLFQKKYKYILFVEPATNFLVKILAKFGLAQRVEYSGLKPEFVDLNQLKRLCNKYNYKINITTLWEIPEDYFRKVCKGEGFIQNILLGGIDFISFIGNFFHFGSFAIVSLEKQS